MMKDNMNMNKFRGIYLAGFFSILALPILVIPPYFFPPDFGKSIIFRSIMALLLLLFVFQLLFKKEQSAVQSVKKNPIALALVALLGVYLVASFFSVDPHFSFFANPYRGGGTITFAFYFIFALLAFFCFKEQDWKKAWVFSMITAALVCLVAIMQYYGLFAHFFVHTPYRPPSTMGNPDILAAYLLLLSFITLSFGIKESFNTYQEKIKKIAYFLCLGLFFYVILISGARAVYAGMAVGLLYFFLLYPKKMRALKIATVIALAIITGFIVYINVEKSYPDFLQKNKVFDSIAPRLSISNLKNDLRFGAWPIEINIVKAKPLLGYGPENFSVGFDNNYDPSISSLGVDVGWWDRAHNIFIQTLSDAGILGLIAYLTLIGVLFWKLHKIKSTESHGIEATLMGYFTANLFSFDSFSTYLIFFLLIGYVLHLSQQESLPTSQHYRLIKGRVVIIGILIILTTWFLWQYNIVPFFINADINKAQDLASHKYCGQALALMDNTLKKHSFLDSYARLKYVEFTKTCATSYPENMLPYQQKGIELIKEAAAIQPLYTRYWIYLGTIATNLAQEEKNTTTKTNLLNDAGKYFEKALQLAPKHYEILAMQSNMEIIAGNFDLAKKYAHTCVSLNPKLGACYWYLGVAQIYTKDIVEANKNMKLASENVYDITSVQSLGELSSAYGFIKDYQNLVSVYKSLISMNPASAQYYSSLAYFYRELGEYTLARYEALKVLELSPESRPNVEAFLKTLP